ncbi:Secretin and TonB N terminus short domain-containing protein [Sphingomonas laterariae]|uniref:Secretin and TonB N terminus short domain-containing protein n=1 Tax=Edaphosphingomonas laterariae TaxID=861865 RepID=A0A239J4S6_9SPHN|nr:TonB-dependent receptor [Sphingomonas laterariae]SNT00488.1 Secretin and TonB N terminus short domain-containing protein [Sphingomonas laterariae]
MTRGILRIYLFSATALSALAISAAPPVAAQTSEQLYDFDIAGQGLGDALNAFARASRQQITFDPAVVRGKTSPPVKGRMSARAALDQLLAGSGLSVRVGRTGLFIVERTAAPVAATFGGADGPDAPSADIIVTAQKREESILNVPIAVTALSNTALQERKIDGGPDIVRGVPNMSFSKSFSSMYNISIRGIGTKALNSSSDPGVAVSYNNTPLIRNRLFEQEFFDMARLEVLRGPQGTLYGRNATGGVVNIIPALPDDEFSAEFKGEIGNYETRRLNGMVNIPITDTFAIRAAGAMTKRDGFDYNTFTQNRVNGRDLWSTRLSAQWEPSDSFKANIIWEHFEEDDDRSRTGKALCTTDPGPTTVRSATVPDFLRGRMSQGCLPGSIYDDAAFGIPNPNSVTSLFVLQSLSLGIDPTDPFAYQQVPVIAGNPYEGIVQSRNPRQVATAVDPVFRAKNDVVQLNFEGEVSDGLTLVSQTAYSRDRWYSSQDYNRFASNPAFNDSRGLLNAFLVPYADDGWTPGGIYNDPQLGPSDRILAVDINRTDTRQWTQELRLQSDWDSALNFNVGANYLDFKTTDDYYAISNMFNMIAEFFYSRDIFPEGGTPPVHGTIPCALGQVEPACIYIDRNPIGQLDDQGHNYFLSRNKVRTKSWSLFGEGYWQAADDVKVTLGLRYTHDDKDQSQIPSQLLLFDSVLVGGQVNSGYPALPDIEQEWGKFTGRLVVDWKPELGFTDDTLIYGSASRGYKAGGANPPRVDFDPRTVQYLPLPDRYKPEYVNAFEIGTKNSLAGGKVSLNATAFFYDYKDYQVSQVTDRITQTENFGAQTWGLELEGAWRPSRAFRMDANLGLLETRLKKGAKSIDIMDRTQGNEDWTVLRPWLQAPSNCIAPTEHVETILNSPFANTSFGQYGLAALCPGVSGFGTFDPNGPAGLFPFWQIFGFTYLPTTEAPNGGRGWDADLEGNELPNSPNLTFNIGAQYSLFFDNDDWSLTFRGDYYYQSSSYARVYNTTFDKLKSWDNLNLSLTLGKEDGDFAMQFYVKNVFDSQPVTDFFLSADDIGLPTNTFYLDPRTYGLNVTVKF